MTQKLRALIADDESAARETLSNYILRYCKNVEIIAEAKDVPEAIAKIKEHKPNLVFLDVEMPFGNAFDVLEQTADEQYETIFVTAYTEYAIKALNFSAAYYILKPLAIEELIKALEKVEENIATGGAVNHTEVIAQNLRNPENKKLVLPTSSGFEVVQIKEIIRLSGSGNYSEIFLIDGRKKVVSKVLRHFQEILEDCGFVRVHKSHIANMEQVTGYHRGRGGVLAMSDGAEIEVSPNKKDEVLKYFKAE